MWMNGMRESSVPRSARSPIRCEVCKTLINPLPGTSKQYVCAGKGNQKSECQKTRRYAREHGITIAEAAARRRG
jgi:hypothetical protein